MAEKSNYEKYLAGEPLNEELRALRAGEPLGFEPGWESLVPARPRDQPMSHGDRQLLKVAKASGVLAIIEQTLKTALETHIRSCTIDSENDPLGRAGDISRQWAYVGMYRRAMIEFGQLIDAEIAELDSESRLLDRHETERATG